MWCIPAPPTPRQALWVPQGVRQAGSARVGRVRASTPVCPGRRAHSGVAGAGWYRVPPPGGAAGGGLAGRRVSLRRRFPLGCPARAPRGRRALQQVRVGLGPSRGPGAAPPACAAALGPRGLGPSVPARRAAPGPRPGPARPAGWGRRGQEEGEGRPGPGPGG